MAYSTTARPAGRGQPLVFGLIQSLYLPIYQAPYIRGTSDMTAQRILVDKYRLPPRRYFELDGLVWISLNALAANSYVARSGLLHCARRKVETTGD